MPLKHPTFRYKEKEKGELLLACTDRAKQVAAIIKKRKSVNAFGPQLSKEQVELEAKGRVRSMGGDLTDVEAILSMSLLQFGKYRGKSFLWLLENDVGWTTMVMAGHSTERERLKTTAPDPQWDNKEALYRYVNLFQDLRRIVGERRNRDSQGATSASNSGDPEGQVLVGFGPYEGMTRDSLFMSSDASIEKYVETLRNLPVKCPGGHLDQLQRYLNKRRADQDLEDAALIKVADEIEEKHVKGTYEAGSVDQQPGPSGSHQSPPPTPAKIVETPQASSLLKSPLPKTWQDSMPPEQNAWLTRVLYCANPKTGKQEIIRNPQMWWHPPQPVQSHSNPPASPAPYFLRPFFLWAPQRLWGQDLGLRCYSDCVAKQDESNCKVYLTLAGLYRTVRRVLDVDGWYYMGTEYLECKFCKRKFAGWSSVVLNQLDRGRQSFFPALLTYRYSCDLKVVRLLRERTLGNSSTKVQKQVSEQHTEVHLQRVLRFLQAREPFHTQSQKGLLTISPPSEQLPSMPPIPAAQWFLAVFVRDVLTRLEEVKANITSTFGSVLKLDSTKKITKKLAGKAAGTVSWCTNIGNEHGQVLMSVMTDSEGEGLDDMATGLMGRYRQADVVPPKLLYVDRGCCLGTGNISRLHEMFVDWPDLVVRSDVWHFLRRFSIACTSQSHALYPAFMSRLSASVFEWDASDLVQLRRAKEGELQASGVWSLEETSVNSRITTKELQLHCRRRTRGTKETTQLIKEVLDTFQSENGKDTMGISLLHPDTVQMVWEEQKRHVECIQDPDGIQLYTKTGTLLKGGLRLPVYRCARGSTSLESFHLHINRFIPGTTANAVNFQAYLLEGIVRWNEDRAFAAIEAPGRRTLSYNSDLRQEINRVNRIVYGSTYDDNFQVPGAYTGEKIGIEYLYSQTGKNWTSAKLDPDEPEQQAEDQEDEGFEELSASQEDDPTIVSPFVERQLVPLVSSRKPSPGVQPPKVTPMEEPQPEEQPEEMAATSSSPHPASSPDSVGPSGVVSWQHIQELAEKLFDLHDEPVLTESAVDELIKLWKALPAAFQQSRVVYPSRYKKDSEHKGRFMQKKPSTTHRQSVAEGMVSLKRAMVGGNSGPATSVDASPLVEAICVKLEAICHSPQKARGQRTVSRWRVMLDKYHHIRNLVTLHDRLMAETNIQLYELNQTTLLTWWNNRQKKLERKVLLQTLPPPAPMEAAASLPPARRLLPKPPDPAPVPHQFPSRPNTNERSAVFAPQASSPPPIVISLPGSSQSTGVSLVPQSPPYLVQAPIPRTTQYYQKRRLKEEEAGNPKKRAYERKTTFNICKHCKQPKTKAYGHSRHIGKDGLDTYCPAVEGTRYGSKEACLAERKKLNPPK